MYKVMKKENYGFIENVEELESREYEVIGNKRIILLIEEHAPYLIKYNKNNNVAITTKPERLQTYINQFNNFKDYKFIFVY